MECGQSLNTVIAERSLRVELFAGIDQSLLIRRDALLVLNLLLDVFDCVGRFDLESDGLSCEGLHKDLHLLLNTKGIV